MLKYWKKNKLFVFLFLLSIVSILIGFLIPSFLPINVKGEVKENVISLQRYVQNHHSFIKGSFLSFFLSNTLFYFLIWAISISVVGVVLLLFLYEIKLFLFSFEFRFFLFFWQEVRGAWGFFYLFSSFLSSLFLFILVYYAFSYSSFLFQSLFLKREYPMKIITRKYLKVLFVSICFSLIFSCFEYFLIPKILEFFF